MVKLHIVQAEYGDCFILESKVGKDSVNVLIDGGPSQTFEKHLKPTLQRLPLDGKLDLLVLSHIDNDHIMGLLDLLQEIKIQRETKAKEFIKISNIWHNSFKNLLLLPEEPVELIANIFGDHNLVGNKEISKVITVKGFQQGTDLTKLAESLDMPINQGFDDVIVVKDKIKSFQLSNVKFLVLGPTRKNLDKLQKEWNAWFTKKEYTEGIKSQLVQILDKSVPNLASIMFLTEIGNRKVLFSGDGLGQDIVEILSKNTMLDSSGKFYVDILKVPHHGSDRNSTQEFFDKVIAEYYIISANGSDDNPSLDTLKWIIESVNPDKRIKKIIITNMTDNVRKVQQKYDQNKFKYEIVILKKGSDYVTITL